VVERVWHSKSRARGVRSEPNEETIFISILRNIWVWWLQQMSDLLRASPLRRPSTPATALVVSPDATDTDTVSLATRRRRKEHLLGRFVLDGDGLVALRRVLSRRRGPVVLRIDPDLLLEREVTLPLAVEPDLANALRFSIDTLTPFVADELFWNWTVLQRDRVNRRLHLRLSLVCKTAVEPLLAALQRAGAGPKLLEFPLSGTETRGIALGGAASRGRLRQHVPAAIAAAAAGALLAIVLLPVALDARALAETDARVDALRPRVAQVEALRRRLTANADDIDVVTRERGRVGDALQVIAVVTDALPDDTYLTEFALHQRKLALSGESAAAAKLLVTLSAEPSLRNPEFVAPVTRAPMGGRDTFSLQTEILP
jgi:general secretion pathway protein L